LRRYLVHGYRSRDEEGESDHLRAKRSGSSPSGPRRRKRVQGICFVAVSTRRAEMYDRGQRYAKQLLRVSIANAMTLRIFVEEAPSISSSTRQSWMCTIQLLSHLQES